MVHSTRENLYIFKRGQDRKWEMTDVCCSAMENQAPCIHTATHTQSPTHSNGKGTAAQNPQWPLVLNTLVLHLFNFTFICMCFSNTYQFCAVFHSKWELPLFQPIVYSSLVDPASNKKHFHCIYTYLYYHSNLKHLQNLCPNPFKVKIYQSKVLYFEKCQQV